MQWFPNKLLHASNFGSKILVVNARNRNIVVVVGCAEGNRGDREAPEDGRDAGFQGRHQRSEGPDRE